MAHDRFQTLVLSMYNLSDVRRRIRIVNEYYKENFTNDTIWIDGISVFAFSANLRFQRFTERV